MRIDLVHIKIGERYYELKYFRKVYIFSQFCKSKINKENGVYIDALKCVEGIKLKMSMVFFWAVGL